jgi:hypothetical protein
MLAYGEPEMWEYRPVAINFARPFEKEKTNLIEATESLNNIQK